MPMVAQSMQFPETFEAWLKQQQLDSQPLPKDAEDALRRGYERQRAAVLAHDVRYMSAKPPPVGEYHYAVAIEDRTGLWLTLWIKRNRRGECVILYPRGPGTWDPHATYHHDGRYHQKSDNLAMGIQHRQPLDHFRGVEHLGSFYGHGVGTAICDPAGFTSVLRVPPGILEGLRGSVLTDLVEPGVAPAAHHRDMPGRQVVSEAVYRDCSPWVVVAIVEDVR